MASPGFLWLIARLFPAKHWDQKYRIDEFLYTKTANRFVVELCQGLVPGKAIDLGGGEGRNSLWLAQQGWRVENIDFSRVALAKFDRWVATEHPQLAANCTTTKADARGFRAKLAPADLGVIAYLQIPQDAIASAIATLVAQLAPGATLVGVWHSRSNLTALRPGASGGF